MLHQFHLLSSAIGLSGFPSPNFSSSIGYSPARSITEFTFAWSVLTHRFPPSARYQDGGRSGWWEIQKHSQQKQRPLGAAHLCDQVREAGGRVRGQGAAGSGSTSALEGRRVSWVPPCRPLPLPPCLPQPLPRAPAVPPFSLGLG